MKKFSIEKEFYKHFKQSNIKGLRAGFISSAKYPNGTKVADVAYFHNYGLGVPMRPFFNKSIEKNMKKWEGILEIEFKKEKVDFEKILNVLGNIIVGDIQEGIRSLKEPPLKAETIKAKGSSNPLIDTGLLIKSVSYKLEK